MYSDFSTLVALREKNFKIYFTLVFIESTSTRVYTILNNKTWEYLKYYTI